MPFVPCIGVIRTPFTDLSDMPIQPAGAADVEGEVVLDDPYAAGLKDIGLFSHIYLIYRFHRADRVELEVVPYLDTVPRGVFATRSPLRPAHIGISVVELRSVEGNVLKVVGVDVVDGTPLLDVKPYVPQFDSHPHASPGWLEKSTEDVRSVRSDDRFA